MKLFIIILEIGAIVGAATGSTCGALESCETCLASNCLFIKTKTMTLGCISKDERSSVHFTRVFTNCNGIPKIPFVSRATTAIPDHSSAQANPNDFLPSSPSSLHPPHQPTTTTTTTTQAPKTMRPVPTTSQTTAITPTIQMTTLQVPTTTIQTSTIASTTSIPVTMPIQSNSCQKETLLQKEKRAWCRITLLQSRYKSNFAHFENPMQGNANECTQLFLNYKKCIGKKT